jgi:hypothetical protein
LSASNRSASRIVLLAIFVAFVVNSQEIATEPDRLYWFWSTECDERELSITVSIDELTNYSWSVPLCHDTWAKRERAGDKIRIRFDFEAKRSFSWSGYTDEVQFNPVGDTINGNIWLAGSEPDGMIIGVTFSSEALDRILMNTIYHASPHKESSVEVSPGLVVRSAPKKSR